MVGSFMLSGCCVLFFLNLCGIVLSSCWFLVVC